MKPTEVQIQYIESQAEAILKEIDRWYGGNGISPEYLYEKAMNIIDTLQTW